MNFTEEIKQFSARIFNIKDRMQTEEAIKTSIILPFFQILGYDIFNPEEFIPEYTTDVGIKKGEKIDYVVMDGLNQSLLIEVKNCPDKHLKRNISQLFRYFVVSKAKFGLLTNGFNFMFFTDLSEKNIMDSESFFEFNILELTNKDILEISRYTKKNFNVNAIYESASELRYLNKIRQLIISQSKQPSDAFINYLLSEVYNGNKYDTIIDEFRLYTKDSLKNLTIDAKQQSNNGGLISETRQTLNQKEMECFCIVKSIIRKIITPDNIAYVDNMQCFTMITTSNPEKWICKIYVKNKREIILPHDNEAGELIYEFESLDDLYELADEIIAVAINISTNSLSSSPDVSR